jgi:hypothetical protein
VEVQESIPESESVPLPVIVTPELNQPAPFGARPGTAVVVGAPVSSLTVKFAEPVFPALSVQLPVSVVPAVSGLL